jgi:hypothetical protein
LVSGALGSTPPAAALVGVAAVVGGTDGPADGVVDDGAVAVVTAGVGVGVLAPQPDSGVTAAVTIAATSARYLVTMAISFPRIDVSAASWMPIQTSDGRDRRYEEPLKRWAS